MAWGGGVDEVAPRKGSSFGTSSGQYQPGIAWKPEDDDMVDKEWSNKAQSLEGSIIRLPAKPDM